MARLIFQWRVNRGLNAHFVCYIFNLFVFHLQVDVVLLLVVLATRLITVTD